MTRSNGNIIQNFLHALAHNVFSSKLVKILAGGLAAFVHFFSYKLHLRERYLLTRDNRVRLRYMAFIAVFITTVFSAVTLVSNHSNALGRPVMSMASIEPAIGYEGEDISNMINGGLYGEVSLATIMVPDEPEDLPLDREVTIAPGDALGLVMEKEGIGSSEATEVIAAMKEHYDPRQLKAGQKVKMHFDEVGRHAQQFREMQIELNPIKTLVVARAGDEFRAQIDERKVEKTIKAQQATVELSLYGSAAKAGIPQSVIANAIHIFSWNIDFQRDIRPKDTLEIMYESYETENGYVAKTGDILYAKLTLSGREIPLYRYEMNDGRIDYFQPDGRSIKRTLMKTPINGARMSSGYGKRHHPVLGYTKMHKGIDFAASTGTPIFAAGDGVVEHAGWFSSFGKYVRIRHNSKLKTAYAHMSKINTTVKVGTRVKQGQIIGYVGTTGRSTGPHLHYEVLLNNSQVNPRSVDLPVGEELVGKDKDNFRAIVRKRSQQFASALEGTKVAEGSARIMSLFN